METKYDPLIFGKNDLEGIVSIEVNEDQAELFIQNKDGSIETKHVPNRFWALASTQLDGDFVRLNGNQYYRYGKQFTEWNEYSKCRGYFKDRVWGIWNKQEALMVKDGYTYFKGMQVKDVSVLAFDIETTGTQITADTKVLLIANTFRDGKGNVTRKMFCHDEYESEQEFIDSWCTWVREVNPSIIIGHNIYNFDIPMLNHIAEYNGTSLKLGRDGSEITFSTRESRFRKDGSQTIGYKKVRIYGREVVDTMFLAIKYDVGRKYESYGLKPIIEHEGLEKEDRQFYDASKIRYNYTNPVEWEKIKKYAEHDGDDALALYDLMIPAFFYMTQSIPKTFSEVMTSASGSQINSMMVRSYLQNANSISKANDVVPFQGAISLGVPGIYKNCFKVDIASLYPSILDQWEVYDSYKDPEGNFLRMVKYFRSERLRHKKLGKETGEQYYKDMEQMEKILINSMYGFLSASGLNYNSPTKAAFVTKKGREILETAIVFATGQNVDYWRSKCNVEEDNVQPE